MDPVPFLSLAPQHNAIHDEVTDALVRGFEKNWFILGDSLRQFETTFAHYSGVDHCIGVGNGYDALFLSLRACGVGAGDEIIVPANTYIATWLAVAGCGATIVPVEPDPLTFNIDVARVEERITSRTKVLLPVHLFGQPCNMNALEEIARRHKIHLIEDNAQAHGAYWNGRKTGSFGVVNATSFYPTKNLGAIGDGGAVTTSDAELARKLRAYRNYGFHEKTVCDHLGVNSRLDELQASVLSIKLRYLDEWNNQRRQIASVYLERLKGIEDLQLPHHHPNAVPVYHLFVVRTRLRDKLMRYLEQAGIGTMIHYPVPPHLQPAYRHLGYAAGDFPVTEAMAGMSLSLPLWPGMSPDQVHFICDAVISFFAG